MSHLPVESAPHECVKFQTSEEHLKTNDGVGTVAMDGEGLTEQLRFAEAHSAKRLLGRESTTVVAINGLSGTGGATEAKT